MSGLPTTVGGEPLLPGLTIAELGERLAALAGAVGDPQRLDGGGWLIPAGVLRDTVRSLRDDGELHFDQLLDITAIDYLTYPAWRAARFAVVYLLKSSVRRHRVTLKVAVEEDEPELPSLHDLYPIANWLERETWDQYGIRFVGHPNLKRLLNHHEFVGHPLRKDYPVQKRQHLSINDPMLDELSARLEQLGYEVLERPTPTISGTESR